MNEHDEGSSLARVGPIALCYEEFGDPADETVLLVMGLGMQMIGWDERFCAGLAAAGFHVVRFDNRDVGRSSKVSAPGRVNLTAGMLGLARSAPYTLADMAGDAVGLLDHLDVGRAHLVGASMGGMIGQTIAVRHRERTASLCSIMAGTGRRRLATLPRPHVLPLLLRAPSSARADYVEEMVSNFEKIGSPGYPRDPDRLRELAGRSFDRCFYPPGTARQLMAVLASGDRTPELRTIEAPTVVVHGAADPLVPPAAARELAAAIPNARLELIDGMGHDLPESLWPRLIELIAENARAGAELKQAS